MTPMHRCPVAILGSGDLGTDLRTKILSRGGALTIGAPADDDVEIVFDAGESGAQAGWGDRGVRVLDLGPGAAGPHCVPAVNIDEHLGAPYLNMGTWGAQAGVPIVAAVGQVATVSYAEVVCALSASSAGPRARAGIDEFIETTVSAVQSVGGARRARAVLILNPADPPIAARTTVYCLVGGDVSQPAITGSVGAMVDRVNTYVPGYRLKQRVQFETFSAAAPLYLPETGSFTGTRLTVLLEIVAVSDHLPDHAGALDIMSSAAVATAERIATRHA